MKAHPWFKNIDWDAVYHRKMQGPIVPHLKGADDTRNFDEYDAEPVHRDPYTQVSVLIHPGSRQLLITWTGTPAEV